MPKVGRTQKASGNRFTWENGKRKPEEKYGIWGGDHLHGCRGIVPADCGPRGDSPELNS